MLENYKYAGFYINSAIPDLCEIVIADAKNRYFRQIIEEGGAITLQPVIKKDAQEKNDRFYLFNQNEALLINTKYKSDDNFRAVYLGSKEMSNETTFAFEKLKINQFVYGDPENLAVGLEQEKNWKQFNRARTNVYKNIDLINDKDKKAIVIEKLLRVALKRKNTLKLEEMKQMVRKRNAIYSL